MEHSPHDYYTDEQKEFAVRAYLAMGTYAKASALCGIPPTTITSWRKSSWWEGVEQKVCLEMEEGYRAGWRSVLEKTLELLRDRVENGNWVLSREGKLVRVPVPARDLIIIAGIAQDKLRLSLGLPSHIVAREADDDRMAKLRRAAESDRESRTPAAEVNTKKH